MEERYVTIVGMDFYQGNGVLDIGQIITLKKEFDNHYDEDAIAVYISRIVQVGYVANSVHTVVRGTKSASRLYDSINDTEKAEVMFVMPNRVIAKMV